MRRLLITMFVAMSCVALFARFYPNLGETVVFSSMPTASYDDTELAAFFGEWGLPLSDEMSHGLKNSTIATLESVLRIQTIQVEQLRRQGRPIFSLLSDPANPLYGFSRVVAPNVDMTVIPPTLSDQVTLSHKFGLGLGLSQLLPTAGSLDLAMRHGITVSSDDGGAWRWRQSPSVALTLRQPLALGDSLLDASYGQRRLERQLLLREGASDAVRRASEEIEVQSMRLRGALQALLENRWLALQQAKLADDAAGDARKDLELGLISRNQVILQENALSKQLLQVGALDREIDSARHQLEMLLGREISLEQNGADLVSLEAIASLGVYQGGFLVEDAQYLRRALDSDADHREAQRDLQVARLERSLGNPSDAPTLSLSMQLSPYYSPTAGNGLFGSVNELFATGEPIFSVSVAFQSSDLSRSSGKTTRALSDEQIVQASIAREAAGASVAQRLRDFQMRIESGLSTLALLLEEYRFAVQAIEIERILAESYQGNTLSMRQRELARYGAAFSLLQHMRSMTLLAAELNLFIGREP